MNDFYIDKQELEFIEIIFSLSGDKKQILLDYMQFLKEQAKNQH